MLRQDQTLQELNDDETASKNRQCRWRPSDLRQRAAVLIANSKLCRNSRIWGTFNELDAAGLAMYGL